MKSDTRGLRVWAVLMAVLVCLAVQAVFTLPAYGEEIIVWGEQGTPSAPLTNLTKIAAGEHHSLALKSVCYFVLAGDVNNDCKMDFYDFALMAESWLIDCQANLSNPACVPK